MESPERNIQHSPDRNISGNREVSVTTIETSNDVAREIKQTGFNKLKLLDKAMIRLEKVLTAPLMDITKMPPQEQRKALKEHNDNIIKATDRVIALAKIVSTADHKTTRQDTTESVSVEIEKVVSELVGDLSPDSRFEVEKALTRRLGG